LTSLCSPCGPPSAVCLAALGSVEKSDEAEQKDFTPNQTFVYDEAGNRLEVTENGMTTKYQPNDANQYAKIAHGTEVVEPEYDPQGNLLHDATRRYTWDADIHLTAVSTQTGQPGTKNPEQRTEFKYDPLHRRIARIKDSGEVTLYTYEGWNVVAEKTTPTAPQLDTENLKLETRYVWGEDLSGTLQGAGGIGGLLRSTIVEAKPNGTRQTEHEHTFSYDSNGNIILLTGAKAQETARYSYDAFGKTLTATGPAAQTNRYQFSTKPVEEESGLVYYGYRWYDPVTGRWPSRDPIEERGGVNLYGMVGNGANHDIDLLGLSSTTDWLNALVNTLSGVVSECTNQCRSECAVCCAGHASYLAILLSLIEQFSASTIPGSSINGAAASEAAALTLTAATARAIAQSCQCASQKECGGCMSNLWHGFTDTGNGPGWAQSIGDLRAWLASLGQ
jgi:RHS repeat-associated protein